MALNVSVLKNVPESGSNGLADDALCVALDAALARAISVAVVAVEDEPGGGGEEGDERRAVLGGSRWGARR